MPRNNRSETVFFRYEGDERKDVHLRIAPSAVRFQQGKKGSVSSTLGGYYVESLYSKDTQYNGKELADLTIEATTGIAYRHELREIDWIWRNQSARKKDGSPADIFLYDLIKDPDYQSIKRSSDRVYLIDIQNFGWDDTVQSPYEIRITFRCKVLRDLFEGLDETPPVGARAIAQIGSQAQELLTARTGLNAATP